MDINDLSGPQGWPVIGNLLQLKSTRLHLILEDWARQFGAFYKLKVLGHRVLILSDPEIILQVLKARPDNFRRNKALDTVFSDMGIKSLLSAEGEQWKRQRVLTTKAFNPNHLRNYFPQMVKSTERLMIHWQNRIKEGKSIDINKDLMKYSIDIIAGLAFGIDIYNMPGGSIIIEHLHKIFPKISWRLQMPIPYWNYIKLPSDFALDKNLAQLSKVFYEFIEQARLRIEKNPDLGEHPTNFIEALVSARDQEGSGFSDDDVFGNVFTMLLLGEDSVASSIAWMVHYLSENPIWQQKMQTEADTFLPSSSLLQSFEQSLELPCCDSVIQETFRLKPVLPLMFLEPISDQTLGEVKVPAGTPMVLLLRAAGLDSKALAEPNKFIPDRKAETDKSPPMVLAFGAGPRVCPARHLAMLQIKMVLTMLARNFTVENVSSAAVEEHFSFTMQPTDIRVKLTERKN